MAESGATTESSSNGSDARKNALRAAAIAAASGATAIAARRAFSDRQESGSSRGSSGGGNGNGNSGAARGGDSLVSGMLASGWGSAKEALVPFAEDAAKAGGEYLAKNGPDVIRETIVPAFIDGFQGAGKKSNDDDDD